MEIFNESQSRLPFVVADAETGSSYVLSKLLGKGSFAKCYLSEEVETGRLFAVKVISSLISRNKNYISKEIAIYSLLYHKNIVNFKTSFTDNTNFYIVLELCSNGSLSQLMKRRNQLTLVEARYMLNQILSGVQYLHSKYIVHGDLKLENIVLNSRLIPKIGDFGVSTLMSHRENLVTEFCGTMEYMAPEIIFKEGHSFAVDIWAVGCISYKLISGKLPFEAGNGDIGRNILSCNFNHYQPGLRKQFSKFILKILQKHPGERPAAKELLKDKFLSNCFIPSRLPVRCLWEAPTYQELLPCGMNQRVKRKSRIGRSYNLRRNRSWSMTGGIKKKTTSKFGQSLHQMIAQSMISSR
ncbi:serine/threonine-protein kinase PLK1 [Nilaparvata lugens]|uniref:serine/threonine-protein kinase PLK1 n=1 Tax=Nilaparvata lugens TaxID=108931 RepID=UPI000B98A42B|nr:serine/threonine-protein kinase PLK1 [Nilaparvata lugens]